MSQTIQVRRGTASAWSAANPVLAAGEPAYATDSAVLKIGDGVNTWSALPTQTLNPTTNVVDFTSVTSEPAVPATGHMLLYSKVIGGRALTKMVGPAGLDVTLQPFMGRNKIGMLIPVGNAATMTVMGAYVAPTTSGAVTARTNATNNLFTRTRRIGLVGSATTAQVVTIRGAATQFSTGGTPGGGFYKIMRFGISDATFISDARMFVGAAASVSAPTAVEPSTLRNVIGVGHGAADTNLKVFFAGSAGQTAVDLGVNFPINTQNVDLYELVLFAPPNTDGMFWEVNRLNTGHSANGFVANNGGAALPSNTTLVNATWCYRTNGSGTTIIGLDIVSDYIETDY